MALITTQNMTVHPLHPLPPQPLPARYNGPQSIPVELAERLIETLNPILDLLAEADRPAWNKRNNPGPRKLEENRWALWRAAMIAHECVAYQGGNQVWRMSPIRRRYEREEGRKRYVNWWEMRCDRPTKRGKPCRNKLSKGRAWCYVHSTQEENEELRIWQDKIHLPYPRIDVGKFVFDISEVTDGLQALVADLS